VVVLIVDEPPILIILPVPPILIILGIGIAVDEDVIVLIDD
jgi:hypothetical protein